MKVVLLPSDFSYGEFPKSLKGVPYQLLVKPHHGSADTVPDLAADTNSSVQARAVLSVGRNTYGHPVPEHIRKFAGTWFPIGIYTRALLP